MYIYNITYRTIYIYITILQRKHPFAYAHARALYIYTRACVARDRACVAFACNKCNKRNKRIIPLKSLVNGTRYSPYKCCKTV
jgi:hypothetical protein